MLIIAPPLVRVHRGREFMITCTACIAHPHILYERSWTTEVGGGQARQARPGQASHWSHVRHMHCPRWCCSS